MVRLEARPGSWGKSDLYLNGEILLCIYPAGDCDTIDWPFGPKDEQNLRSALYDAYETGQLTERTVELPDGTRFDIDG